MANIGDFTFAYCHDYRKIIRGTIHELGEIFATLELDGNLYYDCIIGPTLNKCAENAADFYRKVCNDRIAKVLDAANQFQYKKVFKKGQTIYFISGKGIYTGVYLSSKIKDGLICHKVQWWRGVDADIDDIFLTEEEARNYKIMQEEKLFRMKIQEIQEERIRDANEMRGGCRDVR